MISNETEHESELHFQPFQMRIKNLDKFKNESTSYRVNHRNVLARAKCGTLTSTSKSLEILRLTLQECLNQEIDCIMQKYLHQYFKPAIENIKHNNGDSSFSDYHIQTIFRQILEDAKKMYANPNEIIIKTPTITPNLTSKRKRDGENNFNFSNNRAKQFNKRLSTSDIEKKKIKQMESREIRKAMLKKRKLNKTQTDLNGNSKQVTRGRPPSSNKLKGIEFGEDNLNSQRISINTRFVLGSKANKALGFGSARGRLYTKHSDLFRYIGDQEDSE